jgi:hypothetical protein
VLLRVLAELTAPVDHRSRSTIRKPLPHGLLLEA